MDTDEHTPEPSDATGESAAVPDASSAETDRSPGAVTRDLAADTTREDYGGSGLYHRDD